MNKIRVRTFLFPEKSLGIRFLYIYIYFRRTVLFLVALANVRTPIRVSYLLALSLTHIPHSDRRFRFSYIYFIVIIGGILVLFVYIYIYIYVYTGCPRRNVPDFGRVFLMLKYTDITQNTYVQI